MLYSYPNMDLIHLAIRLYRKKNSDELIYSDHHYIIYSDHKLKIKLSFMEKKYFKEKQNKQKQTCSP